MQFLKITDITNTNLDIILILKPFRLNSERSEECLFFFIKLFFILYVYINLGSKFIQVHTLQRSIFNFSSSYKKKLLKRT